MKRFGTVLTFKEGVTLDEAAEALMALQDVVDLTGMVDDVMTDASGDSMTIRRAKTLGDFINTFDDDFGGPVWYCP